TPAFRPGHCHARKSRFNLDLTGLPRTSPLDSNMAAQSARLNVIRLDDSSVNAICQTCRRDDLEPDRLPYATRGRIEDALRLRAPVLFTAGLSEVIRGIIHPHGQPMR